MTATPPATGHGRAGRNLPAAVGSAVVLLAASAASLFFWTPGHVGQGHRPA